MPVKRGTGSRNALHVWLAKNYGNANHCDNPLCEHRSSMFHWAKIADKEYEWKRENFMQLCALCHRRYDHPLDPNVTGLVCHRCKQFKTFDKLVRTNQRRLGYIGLCLECQKVAQRQYWSVRSRRKHGEMIERPVKKLTRYQAINIWHVQGAIPGYKLAAMYGVNRTTIHDIWQGRRWKSIREGVA